MKPGNKSKLNAVLDVYFDRGMFEGIYDRMAWQRGVDAIYGQMQFGPFTVVNCHNVLYSLLVEFRPTCLKSIAWLFHDVVAASEANLNGTAMTMRAPWLR